MTSREMHNGCCVQRSTTGVALTNPLMTEQVAVLPSQFLNARELLLSVQILRKDLITVRFVLELGHDLWRSIA